MPNPARHTTRSAVFKQHRGADFGQEALSLQLKTITITCKSDRCKQGKTFEWQPNDQVFAIRTFARRGTPMPKWCPGCRKSRKDHFRKK